MSSEPKRLAEALGGVVARSQPATPLAAVQTAWSAAVGKRIATVATPVSERSGVVTVACCSAVWAEQLDLLQNDLIDRLRREMGGVEAGFRLRFVVAR